MTPCPHEGCDGAIERSPPDPRSSLPTGVCRLCRRGAIFKEDGAVRPIPTCGCGKDHGDRGHPYMLGEARLVLEKQSARWDEYHRSLFRNLIERIDDAIGGLKAVLRDDSSWHCVGGPNCDGHRCAVCQVADVVRELET